MIIIVSQSTKNHGNIFVSPRCFIIFKCSIKKNKIKRNSGAILYPIGLVDCVYLNKHAHTYTTHDLSCNYRKITAM